MIRSDKIYIILIIIHFISISLFSCGPPKYGIANTSSEIKYLKKPAFRDSLVKGTYITGSYQHGTGYDSLNTGMVVQFGEVSFHRGITDENFTYAFGGFVYGGNYSVYQFEDYRGKKRFYGTGITGELQLNIRFEALDVRVLGLRSSLMYEDGEYSKFRSDADKENLVIDIHPSNLVLSAHLVSEFIAKLNNFELGFFNALGMIYGGEGNFFVISHTFPITYKKTTFFLQASYTPLRNDVNVNVAYGLTYKINK